MSGSNITGFIFSSLVLCIAIFLGALIRLYLIAHLKIKTILLISVVLFVLGELFLFYYFFLNHNK